jgi:hypothetical protein
MENEIVEISQIETLQAINRSEIDMQISTAKQYPRDLSSVLKNIRDYATIDAETAADCFYALKRGQGNDASVIEGLSVRMAEIFASSWGNLRVQTRIIGNDGKTITAQGICHDLETNVAVSVEVKRRITNKYGKTFSEDMQVVTGNAASAIAFRNAVFKVIPKALTKKIVEEIKKASLPPISDMESKREKTIKWFTDRGVKVEEILKYIESDSIENIGIEQLLTLRSTANAINEGTTTIEETFHQRETIEEMKKEMKTKTDKQGKLNLP